MHVHVYTFGSKSTRGALPAHLKHVLMHISSFIIVCNCENKNNNNYAFQSMIIIYFMYSTCTLYMQTTKSTCMIINIYFDIHVNYKNVHVLSSHEYIGLIM